MSFYLGFDASTQSLTATLIAVGESDRRVVGTETFRYDDELPSYGTSHGALHQNAEVVVAPPRMWAEALDHMMARLAATYPRETAAISAVAVSAQQHGSVYLTADGLARLSALDPAVALAAQLDAAFARPHSPIWLDSSTSADCERLTRDVGGPGVLAAHTGSRAYERFTGPQIRKFARLDPEGYRATARIDLVSSFLTSLLAGTPAPVDPGDGAGMNLMDLEARAWWPRALEATAPGLSTKLPAIADARTMAGTLAPYWRTRYGFAPAHVVVGTGDNPSSLIGTGLVALGRLAVSLGTSNTVFGLIPALRPSDSGEGHVFGAPTGGLMGLTCFANGSIARETIRDRHHLSWPDFSAALQRTPPGNRGGLLLPWFAPEITPHSRRAHVRRIDLDDTDADRNVRAVIEAQMMAMANRTDWMNVEVREIYATGGASANRDILQVMADVFGADVVRLPVTNSACLGAALRARHAHVQAAGGGDDWHGVIEGFVNPAADGRVRPSDGARQVYRTLRERYAALEAETLHRDSLPH
jgi:xylulokinase